MFRFSRASSAGTAAAAVQRRATSTTRASSPSSSSSKQQSTSHHHHHHHHHHHNNSHDSNQMGFLYNLMVKHEKASPFLSSASMEKSSKKSNNISSDQQQHELNLIQASNKSANDILHLVSSELRDFDAVGSKRNPNLVCRLIKKVCEESNMAFNAADNALQSQQQHHSNATYSIQKNTVVSLILNLSKFEGYSIQQQQQNNNNNNNQQNQNLQAAKTLDPRQAELAMAALCEMALPHIHSFTNTEWFGIIQSFAKLKLLHQSTAVKTNETVSSSIDSTSSSSSIKTQQHRESQRACAFMLYLAFEKLLIENAESSMFLLRVKDSQAFSLNLTKLLPVAIRVLPLQPPEDFTWQSAIKNLFEKQILVVEICSCEQATLIFQNACQLVDICCSTPSSASSSSSETSLAIEQDKAELLETFSRLCGRIVERITTILSVHFIVDRDDVQQQQQAISDVDFKHWKLNETQAQLHQSEINTTTIQLFSASTNAMKTVVKKVLLFTKNPQEDASTSSSHELIIHNIEKLLKLTIFTASIGPQLLEGNLKSHLSSISSSNHHQEEEIGKEQQQQQQQLSENSSSLSSSASPLSNAIGVMMNIENQHVVLRSEINSALKTISTKKEQSSPLLNNVLQTTLESLQQSQQNYVVSSNSTLYHFDAHSVSSIQSLLYILQCMSNRLRTAEEERTVAAAAVTASNLKNSLKAEEEEVGGDEDAAEEDDDEEVISVAEIETVSPSTSTPVTPSLLTETHRLLFPFVLLVMTEIEHRATTDSKSRTQLISSARQTFDTARRLTPFFSSALLAEILEQSKDDKDPNQNDNVAKTVLDGVFSSSSSANETDSTSSATSRFLLAKVAPFATKLILSYEQDVAKNQKSHQNITTTSSPEDSANPLATTTKEEIQRILVATSFKGFLRMIRAGLTSSKPAPKLGPSLAIANYLVNEVEKVFELTHLPTKIRDILLLDSATVLMDLCHAALPTKKMFLSTSTNEHLGVENSSLGASSSNSVSTSTFKQMTGLSMTLSRMFRLCDDLKKEREKELKQVKESLRNLENDKQDLLDKIVAVEKEMKAIREDAQTKDNSAAILDQKDEEVDPVPQDLHDKKKELEEMKNKNLEEYNEVTKQNMLGDISLKTLQIAMKRICRAADALCNDNIGKLRLLLDQRNREAEEIKEKMGAKNDQPENSTNNDILPTRLVLSLAQRFIPLLHFDSSSIASSPDASNNSRNNKKNRGGSNQPNQQNSNNSSTEFLNISQFIAYTLLTIIPRRVSELSALEATLTLNAMQSSKLWRHNVVVMMMNVVKEKHVAVDNGETSSSALASSSSTSSSSSAARELSSALISLVQFTGTKRVADEMASEKDFVVSTLVQSLLKLPPSEVPMHTILSVWKRIVSNTSAATSNTIPFDTFQLLMQRATKEIETEMNNKSSSEFFLTNFSDFKVLIDSLQSTAKLALTPLAGGKIIRAETLKRVRALVVQLVKFLSSSEHLQLEEKGEVSSSSSSFDNNNNSLAVLHRLFLAEGESTTTTQQTSNDDDSITNQISPSDFRLCGTVFNLIKYARFVPSTSSSSSDNVDQQNAEDFFNVTSQKFVENLSLRLWKENIEPCLRLTFLSNSSSDDKTPNLDLESRNILFGRFGDRFQLLVRVTSSSSSLLPSSSSSIVHENIASFFEEYKRVSMKKIEEEKQKNKNKNTDSSVTVEEKNEEASSSSAASETSDMLAALEEAMTDDVEMVVVKKGEENAGGDEKTEKNTSVTSNDNDNVISTAELSQQKTRLEQLYSLFKLHEKVGSGHTTTTQLIQEDIVSSLIRTHELLDSSSCPTTKTPDQQQQFDALRRTLHRQSGKLSLVLLSSIDDSMSDSSVLWRKIDSSSNYSSLFHFLLKNINTALTSSSLSAAAANNNSASPASRRNQQYISGENSNDSEEQQQQQSKANAVNFLAQSLSNLNRAGRFLKKNMQPTEEVISRFPATFGNQQQANNGSSESSATSSSFYQIHENVQKFVSSTFQQQQQKETSLSSSSDEKHREALTRELAIFVNDFVSTYRSRSLAMMMSGGSGNSNNNSSDRDDGAEQQQEVKDLMKEMPEWIRKFI